MLEVEKLDSARGQLMREQVKAKEAKALEEMEFDYRKRELEVDRKVSQRRFEAENQRLQALKEAQIKEKKELLDRHMPADSSLKGVLGELAEEEEQELQEFRREQEVERQRREEELARQEQQLL